MISDGRRQQLASNTDVTLSTERLEIRQFELADAGFILQLLNDESFLRFIGDKGVRTIADACHYLSHGPLASYREHGFGLYHVVEKTSGNSIGMCGLLSRREHEHPDIGFAFLSEFQGLGYAEESATAVMNYGQAVFHMPTIIAFVDPANDRSIRLLRKLGLVFAGTTMVSGIETIQSRYSSRPRP